MTGAGRDVELKMGVKSSMMIKYIQDFTKEVKGKSLPRGSNLKYD